MKTRLIFAALTIACLPAVAQPDAEPRWWKGNLHTHSFWSDGNDFPESIVGWYADNGYHFLALSDHNVLSEGERWMPMHTIQERSRGEAFEKYLNRFGEHWVETREHDERREVRLKPFEEYRSLFQRAGEFLLMPAEEVTGSAGNNRAIHINVTNLTDRIDPAEAETVAEVIRITLANAKRQAQASARPIMVHVNHPNYKWGVTAEDLAEVVEERFFEVWNGVDGDNDPGNPAHPSTDEIWDIANTLRIAGMNAPPLFGLANDDSHNYHWLSPRAFPGRAWVQVRARHLTPESILGALERGDFYASTGVTLRSIEFDANTLTIEIEPAEGETYTTEFIGTRQGVSLSGKQRTDAWGNLVETTLDYSGEGPSIGEVLARQTGTRVSYTLAGDELYVRAVITSDAIPDIPSRESQLKKAWTQPVGW